MSDSTTNLDLVAVGQGQKETTVNAVLNAGSPATYFGLRRIVGLTWHYYGAIVDPLSARIPNGSLNLTASSTCYIEHTTAGVASFNTVAFTAGRIPDYIAVTDTDEVSSYQDVRGGGTQTVTLTGDVTGSGAGSFAATIAANAVTLAKMAQVATARFLGRTTASTGNVEALTGTQATAMLDNVVGDAGAGGTKGLVPAPGAGDTAAGKFLKADGTYAVPVGSGDVVGPASAVNNNLSVFDGTTGKLVKDGGAAPTGTNTGDQTTISGNAGTATALQTARTIGGVSFDGTANITQPFDATAFYPGAPTASAIVVRVPFARAVSFVANFAGSYGVASVAATASTAFDITKNGSSVGTATFAIAATTATFVSAGGASQTFAAGDILAIVSPASPDATLANVGFVLAGTR